MLSPLPVIARHLGYSAENKDESEVVIYSITIHSKYQGCINSYINRADPGICQRRAVPPVPFRSLFRVPPLPFSLEVRPLKPAISSPCVVPAKPRPKTNLVHSKAVRKPLVAIISNILSTMFYNRTINI